MKTPKTEIYPDFFEQKAWKSNLLVCGTDEAGRGCLAGPLVVSAVILPFKKHELLQDSKKLSEKQRNLAYKWIIENCYFSTSFISPQRIDLVNIYTATQMAMQTTIKQLLSSLPFQIIPQVKYILSDAMPINIQSNTSNFEHHHMDHGETYSKSIAAASIVAKVTRDKFINKMDQIFPGFDFSDHKGYGTQKHLEALKKLGETIIHRKSFIKTMNTRPTNEKQQSLFN